MIAVLGREQARAFDRWAIDRCHVAGAVLMENAGRGATDVLERELLGGQASAKRVGVVCGVGNNGGDGFVIARHLALRGAAVAVVLVGDAARSSAEATGAREAWLGIGGMVSDDLASLDACEVLVDALFGTGLVRAVTGGPAKAIAYLRDSGRPVLAVDVPSGLDADTGQVFAEAVHASVTVTFAHPKRGLLTPAGAEHAGRVIVVDIGVPTSLVAHTGHDASLMGDEDARAWLPRRAAGAHKYVAGHVAVFAGSTGKAGAALLSARGALRAGAGVVTIATWADSAAAVEAGARECMVVKLERGEAADFDPSVEAILAGKRAVVLGPGFGVDATALRVVSEVLACFDGVAVVDADALTLFAGRAGELAAARARLVLTPHEGEAARLLGTTSARVASDRFAAVRALAALAGCVVLLKGAHTLIADPDGRVVVSPVVCPALATAGSGDVLSGVVAALGCHLGPFQAACVGALVHGRAGERGGVDRGWLASEIADAVMGVMAAFTGGHTPRPCRHEGPQKTHE